MLSDAVIPEECLVCGAIFGRAAELKVCCYLTQERYHLNEIIALHRSLFEDWLEFSKDVTPGCAAGHDWLEHLRTATQMAVDTIDEHSKEDTDVH